MVSLQSQGRILPGTIEFGDGTPRALSGILPQERIGKGHSLTGPGRAR
jgi:hypothetical protein